MKIQIHRSPRWERELKFRESSFIKNILLALPTQGAKIENFRSFCHLEFSFSRSPHRERELKTWLSKTILPAIHVAPHARARIEITRRTTRKPARTITPHTGNENWNCSANLLDLRQNDRSPYGERELKSNNVNNTAYGIWSLPTRGVWIEIDVNQIFGAIENDRSPYGE